jgi:hypothetical protein
VRGLQGLVRAERDVARRLGLEDQQRFAGDEHVAVAALVDHLRVVGLDRADHLIGNHPWLQAIGFLDAEVGEHGFAALHDLALVAMVDFEQSERALDHHDRGRDLSGLERHVGDAIDDESGRGLDEYRRVVGNGEEAARGTCCERHELFLGLSRNTYVLVT